MNIRPLNGRVVIKRTEVRETSPGGIFLGEQERDTPSTGVVMALSDRCSNANHIKVGDVVLFGKYSGTEKDVDGELLLFIAEEDLIAVEEK